MSLGLPAKVRDQKAASEVAASCSSAAISPSSLITESEVAFLLKGLQRASRRFVRRERELFDLLAAVPRDCRESSFDSLLKCSSAILVVNSSNIFPLITVTAPSPQVRNV